ncbi:MAG TPA: DUF1015 domain-containing protein [Stenomitos sp.]
MADIRPFRAARYHPAKARNLTEVICPPYDTIGPKELYRYYLRHPYNAIRLELGQENPSDTAQNNRNTRAGETWTEWLRDNVLRRDEMTGLYVYEQAFHGGSEGPARVRRGFFALVGLEAPARKVVLPIQDSDPERVSDRLALLSAVHANTSPVVALYDDPDQDIAELLMEICDEPPFQTFVDEFGEEHRLWRVIDPALYGRILEGWDDRALYLIEGSSRYKAALAYQEHLNSHGADPVDGLHNFILTLLVDTEDPGLTLTPVHRLVKAEVPADFVSRLDACFEVFKRPVHPDLPFPEQVESILAEESAPGRLHVVRANELTFYTLVPRPEAMPDLVHLGHAAEWERLDVTVLHEVVLKRILGFNEEAGRIAYARDHREVLMGLGSGQFDLAFFLHAPELEALQAIARQLDTLPDHTADLYPQVPAGIVFNSLEGTIQHP